MSILQNMQCKLFFFALFIYEKLSELILMPAIDLVTSTENSELTIITQISIVLVAVGFLYILISFISLSVYHQSKTYHPAMFYGFFGDNNNC